MATACGATTPISFGDHAHTGAWTAASTGRNEDGKFCVPFPLWSDTLGLSGRADAVEMKDGEVRPVEYKSGVRHGTAADFQVCAQALCLEEMLGVDIPYGFVWHGGPRRREKVEFSTALRRDVCDVIEQIRTQLLTAILPEAPNDARCTECQLLHHCLPQLTSAPHTVADYMTSVVFQCDS